MSKRTLFLLAVMISLALCTAGFAQAFGPNPPCNFSQRGPNPRCIGKSMQNLDLTDSQQAALDKIRNETCAQIEPLASQISAAELYKTLSAEEINETEAAAKIAEIVGLKSQIKTIMLNSRLASALILTPEQRQELSDEVGNCKNWQPKGSGWMRR